MTKCQLNVVDLKVNKDLSKRLIQTESAYNICAAQVDMIFTCQQKEASNE